MSRHVSTVAVLLVLAAGCASMKTQDERLTQGPTAEQMWTARVLLVTGREPSFDEKQRWDDETDRRVSQYLARHPQLANSLDVATFRMTRQVTLGMERELVLLLLGPPVLATKDAAEIEKLARAFWPAVKANAPTEAWLYPHGWRFFLDDARVVDITKYLEP